MTSSHIPIRTKDYKTLVSQFPPDTPCVVCHMIQFNETAQYPPGSPYAALPKISGRDAFFTRYVRAGEGAAKELGISPAQQQIFSPHVVNLLQHKDVPWDVVSIRRYSSFEEYARYQSSSSYQTNAVPHRDAALKDWSLVACIEGEHP